ncbi:hypothetical protein ACJJTC_014779 [Scirpophaga incertulas]
MLQFGFNTGVINAPRSFIENFIRAHSAASPGSSHFQRHRQHLRCRGNDRLTRFSSSAGSPETRGRKQALMINAIIFGVIGAILMGFSKANGSVVNADYRPSFSDNGWPWLHLG